MNTAAVDQIPAIRTHRTTVLSAPNRCRVTARFGAPALRVVLVPDPGFKFVRLADLELCFRNVFRLQPFISLDCSVLRAAMVKPRRDHGTQTDLKCIHVISQLYSIITLKYMEIKPWLRDNRSTFLFWTQRWEDDFVGLSWTPYIQCK